MHLNIEIGPVVHIAMYTVFRKEINSSRFKGLDAMTSKVVPTVDVQDEMSKRKWSRSTLYRFLEVMAFSMQNHRECAKEREIRKRWA